MPLPLQQTAFFQSTSPVRVAAYQLEWWLLILFLVPLVYKYNKEVIDEALQQFSDIKDAQVRQLKDLAGEHTAVVTDTAKKYASDYTTMAQDYIGSARRPEPAVPSGGKSAAPMAEASSKSGPVAAEPKYQESNFPHAPKQEPAPGVNVTSHQEQYEKSPLGGQAVPAS